MKSVGRAVQIPLNGRAASWTSLRGMGRVWTPWTLFLLVFTTNLLTNFDSGALPAVLNQLRASPQYTPTASTPDVAPSAPPAVPAQPEPVLASAKQGRAPRAPKPSRHPARRLDQTFERNFDPWSPTGVADAGADGTETQRGKCTSGCHGFSLGYFELGVLGALPYIALSVVSPFVGALLQRARVRRVLLLAVVVNGAACLLFGLATSAWLLQVTRFGVGLSQAFAVIYFPVWTDAKAPPESKTFYMSMMQAGVPLGIVCGYLVGGLLTSFLDTEHSLVAGWRLPFLLQGAVLIPLGLAFATVPEAMLEVSPDALPLASPSRVRSDAHSSSFAAAAAGGGAAARKGGDGSPHQSVYAMASELWRSPVYMYVLLCLTSIFFIVSGIQYWVTIFLTDHFGMDEATVVRCAVLACSGRAFLCSYVPTHLRPPMPPMTPPPVLPRPAAPPAPVAGWSVAGSLVHDRLRHRAPARRAGRRLACRPCGRLLEPPALPARARQLHCHWRGARGRHCARRECRHCHRLDLAAARDRRRCARARDGRAAHRGAGARAHLRLRHLDDGVQPARLLPGAIAGRRRDRGVRGTLGLPARRQLGRVLVPLPLPRHMRCRRRGAERAGG